jgi:hypothetical protein
LAPATCAYSPASTRLRRRALHRLADFGTLAYHWTRIAYEAGSHDTKARGMQLGKANPSPSNIPAPGLQQADVLQHALRPHVAVPLTDRPREHRDELLVYPLSTLTSTSSIRHIYHMNRDLRSLAVCNTCSGGDTRTCKARTATLCPASPSRSCICGMKSVKWSTACCQMVLAQML